jgi:hypothetical protein
MNHVIAVNHDVRVAIALDVMLMVINLVVVQIVLQMYDAAVAVPSKGIVGHVRLENYFFHYY